MVIGSDRTLTGIITDGDIRRMVATKKSPSELTVDDVMTKNPRTVDPEAPAYDALYVMEKHQITVLPVVNDRVEIQGILHLHDILGKGQFKFNDS
jgi:arabinose-5-phosphate isomerase